jgi:hypothetical protein
MSVRTLHEFTMCHEHDIYIYIYRIVHGELQLVSWVSGWQERRIKFVNDRERWFFFKDGEANLFIQLYLNS